MTSAQSFIMSAVDNTHNGQIVEGPPVSDCMENMRACHGGGHASSSEPLEVYGPKQAALTGGPNAPLPGLVGAASSNISTAAAALNHSIISASECNLSAAEEQKYIRKCAQLSKLVSEAEEENDKILVSLQVTRQNIQRLRAEKEILMEYLMKTHEQHEQSKHPLPELVDDNLRVPALPYAVDIRKIESLISSLPSITQTVPPVATAATDDIAKQIAPGSTARRRTAPSRKRSHGTGSESQLLEMASGCKSERPAGSRGSAKRRLTAAASSNQSGVPAVSADGGGDSCIGWSEANATPVLESDAAAELTKPQRRRPAQQPVKTGAETSLQEFAADVAASSPRHSRSTPRQGAARGVYSSECESLTSLQASPVSYNAQNDDKQTVLVSPSVQLPQGSERESYAVSDGHRQSSISISLSSPVAFAISTPTRSGTKQSNGHSAGEFQAPLEESPAVDYVVLTCNTRTAAADTEALDHDPRNSEETEQRRAQTPDGRNWASRGQGLFAGIVDYTEKFPQRGHTFKREDDDEFGEDDILDMESV